MRKRPSARLLVLDQEDRVLLFQFVFDDGPLAGTRYWGTPGGALEPDEDYPAAARRELLEETGIAADVGEEVAQRDVIFQTPSGEEVMADERYFLVRVVTNHVDESGQGSSEAQYMQAHRWWPLSDLVETSDTVFPEGLVPLLERLTLNLEPDRISPI